MMQRLAALTRTDANDTEKIRGQCPMSRYCAWSSGAWTLARSTYRTLMIERVIDVSLGYLALTDDDNAVAIKFSNSCWGTRR